MDAPSRTNLTRLSPVAVASAGVLTAIAALVVLPACRSKPAAASGVAAATVAAPGVDDNAPRDYRGLHNVVAFHDHYYSGSVPEGDAGFDSLQALGVRTIISVDAMEPDVAAARARGLRYIHLPIGYNGFDDERRLELARATRDALRVGPVYIHCHHGKHRSAGAAAAAIATLGLATPEAAVQRMKVSGTSPAYPGLYQCALDSRPVSPEALAAVNADFPEVSRPATFVRAMVELDHVFDHLSDAERAGWQTPADHPDLVPAAEAARMVDLFRQLQTSDEAAHKPADFAAMLKADEARAQTLEDTLTELATARAHTATSTDSTTAAHKATLSATFKQIGASCKECHVKHRDRAPW
ncbi:MAG TPA: hypothetical protein VD997_12130 [Phycisphaerales bacterium]|nr:hypothetical protein [Phycisphaerales bacterium]